jgi:hypothetical protein
LGRIFRRWLRWSKRWFFRVEDLSLRDMSRLGQFRVRRKWLTRTWHRFGYHIDLLGRGRFLSFDIWKVITIKMIESDKT